MTTDTLEALREAREVLERITTERCDPVHVAVQALSRIDAALAEGEGDDGAEFELIQNDSPVASACGPRGRALAEIMHYAAVYGQDGPVEIFEIVRTPVLPAFPIGEKQDD